MSVSKLSGALRIALGLGIVAAAIGAGLLQRSPWIMPFMAAGFTSAYRFGQLRTWRVARSAGTLGGYWKSLPIDFLVQLVLVSVLYLIGFGLSALLSGGVKLAAFAPGDAIWPLALGAVASILGLYIDRIEGHPVTLLPSWLASEGGEDAAPGARSPDLRILPGPVTAESFYSSIHHSHGAYAAPPHGAFDASPNEKSAGRTDDDIVRAEAKLGRALPDGLIALYKQQNGGGLGEICIPREGAPELATYDAVIMPFSGYNDLDPVERLRTVWEAVTDYADPGSADEAGQFPEGCKAMVVLAQWYRETLFLDYNLPGAPRVGFTDFDRFGADGKRAPITWWPDFETFFAALRHFEQV